MSDYMIDHALRMQTQPPRTRVWKIKPTPANYTKRIPACCSLRTFREHRQYLALCWSVTSSMETGGPINCGDCEMRDDQHP